MIKTFFFIFLSLGVSGSELSRNVFPIDIPQCPLYMCSEQLVMDLDIDDHEGKAYLFSLQAI